MRKCRAAFVCKQLIRAFAGDPVFCTPPGVSETRTRSRAWNPIPSADLEAHQTFRIAKM